MALRYLGNLFHGEKVYLTRLVLDDLKTLAPHIGFEYMRWASLQVAYPRSAEKVMEEIAAQVEKRHAFEFAIRLKADESVIGSCGIFDIAWNMHNAKVGIGIARPEQRGQGYGTEALAILLRFGFMELNLDRLWLEVASYNERAIASYTKLGFQKEVTLRETVYRDGTYFDVYVMGLLRSEWQA